MYALMKGFGYFFKMSRLTLNFEDNDNVVESFPSNITNLGQGCMLRFWKGKDTKAFSLWQRAPYEEIVNFYCEHFKGTKAMTWVNGGNRLRCLREVSGLLGCVLFEKWVKQVTNNFCIRKTKIILACKILLTSYDILPKPKHNWFKYVFTC